MSFFFYKKNWWTSIPADYLDLSGSVPYSPTCWCYYNSREVETKIEIYNFEGGSNKYGLWIFQPEKKVFLYVVLENQIYVPDIISLYQDKKKTIVNLGTKI